MQGASFNLFDKPMIKDKDGIFQKGIKQNHMDRSASQVYNNPDTDLVQAAEQMKNVKNMLKEELETLRQQKAIRQSMIS